MKSSFKKIVIILVLMVVVCAISLSIMKLNRNNDSNADATNTTEPQVELSIVAPSGAPALSLAGVINDPTLLLNYEIVDGADVLSAEFTNAEKDLIIAPVNLGNKLISNGANYKMIGVVTWGNLYIAGNEAFGGKIAAFGQGAVPEKIVNYVFGEEKDFEIEYFASVQEASSMLISGKYSAALLAEPVLTMTKAKYAENNEGEVSILYNLQEEYKNVSGYDSYPQAALFVKNDTLNAHKDSVLEITNKMRSTISSFNSDSEQLKSLKNVDFEALGFANLDFIVKAYPRMALNFVYSDECVDEVANFLKLFDMDLPETNYIK